MDSRRWDPDGLGADGSRGRRACTLPAARGGRDTGAAAHAARAAPGATRDVPPATGRRWTRGDGIPTDSEPMDLEDAVRARSPRRWTGGTPARGVPRARAEGVVRGAHRRFPR